MEAIHSGSTTVYATVNQMGFMYDLNDEYVNAFIQYAGTVNGTILDTGCAFGATTKRLLQAGATDIIANDLSPEHLQILTDSLAEKEAKCVRVIPGDALDLARVIPENSLAGILAANWLHFLQPADVQRAFTTFFRLLRPGGKLCVITFSTTNGYFKETWEGVRRRKAAGDEWPGLIGDFLMMDPDVLEREAKRAGFRVEKCGFWNFGEVFELFRSNGQEGSGLLTVKPVKWGDTFYLNQAIVFALDWLIGYYRF